MTSMEISDYLAALRREGDALASVAARAALDAPIPTCAGWNLRDLIRHTGGVHRWATAHVAEGRTTPMASADEAILMSQWPADDALIAWFREGHATLCHVLETAAPDLSCWSFLPAPSPLAFWARRQAHETTIHRADAEGVVGAITPVLPAFAADGIDELLSGFFSRPRGRLRTDPPRTLHLQAIDADREWYARIGPTRVDVRETGEGPDCTVRGSASDLYFLLWNRRQADDLEILGDAALLELWRLLARITW